MGLPPGWQFPTIEALESHLRGEDAVGYAVLSAKAGDLVPIILADDVGDPPAWCSGSCSVDGCDNPCGSFASEDHSTCVCLAH